MRLPHKIIILFAILTFVGVSHAQDEMPQDQAGIINWLKNKFSGMEVSEVSPQEITVYCRVVDQTGIPVPGARIRTSTKHGSLTSIFDPVIKENWLTSATDGSFQFTAYLEDDPSIWQIEKKGYEFLQTDPYYSMNVDEEHETFKQSANQPLVFTLRKMGPTTYLYNNNGGGYFAEPLNFIIYDIFRQSFKSIDRDLSQLGNPELYDLIVDITREGDSYILKILPVQKAGFMQIVDQMLYEAPPDGYLDEMTLTLNIGETRETYLYFTSRDPVVYSRMKMELSVDETELHFRYDTWTNPYGSRNLEYEPNIPSKLDTKLFNETEVALKSGKLPPEPDIPAMIASGQYN